jgi:hypothetical protein
VATNSQAGNIYTPVDLLGEATTAGTAEETVQISADGAAAADTYPIAAGKRLDLDVIQFTAEAAARFKVQKTTDGLTWYTIHPWRQPQDGSTGVAQESLIPIVGGANVAIRARAQTPGGAAVVTVSIHASLMNNKPE